jgi:hypothetical protein
VVSDLAGRWVRTEHLDQETVLETEILVQKPVMNGYRLRSETLERLLIEAGYIRV